MLFPQESNGPAFRTANDSSHSALKHASVMFAALQQGKAIFKTNDSTYTEGNQLKYHNLKQTCKWVLMN